MSALIYCPFPDRKSARTVTEALLDEQLIACANILGEVEAIFVWQGQRGRAEEVGVLFKTDSGVVERAVTRLVDLHPYDTPAVMGWRCDAVPQSTQDWLKGSGSEG